MPLTDTEVRKAKAQDEAYRLSDGGSLYLWVTPAGGKLWRWAYKHEGKEKLMSFGKYPDVPLALARERHAEARKLLATGVDPMAQRKAEKTAEKVAVENSFQSIATRGWSIGRRGKARAMWITSGGAWRPIFCPASVRAPLQRLKRRNWWRWPMRFRIAARGILPNVRWRRCGQVFRYTHCPRICEAQPGQ